MAQKTTYLALGMLVVMFFLIIGSARNNAAIFDETAHIPAGYSYVTRLDYRLNPEHPPLIKIISALPLLFFKNIKFPDTIRAWTEDVNGQWSVGHAFLYESGNNPDQILFWMRLPIMILGVLLGLLIFWWTKKRFNKRTAFLATLFYAFSPTFIAHSQFVTTDVGATLAFFASAIFFIVFLENPSWRNTLFLGIIFGIAQTVKFSLFLLVPMFFIATIFWVYAKTNMGRGERIQLLGSLFGKIVVMGFIGLAVIWIIFAPLLLHYPQDKNIADAKQIISGFRFAPLVTFDLFLLGHTLLRPIGQYLFGLMMITQRQIGGNTEFFLGEITSKGSHFYFPLLYILKETLALHIVTLIALWHALKKTIFLRQTGVCQKISLWTQEHTAEFVIIVITIFYWTYSALQPLNIGIRHVLPTFPFIYILVSRQIDDWLKSSVIADPKSWWDWFRNVFHIFIASIPRYAILGILLVWMMISTVSAFPNYLSYYNELAGGTANGYLVSTDSNYDWGQDLIRLKQYVEANNISKIAVDYFGGGDPKFYLGDKEENWWPGRGNPKDQGIKWFAISANAQMGAYGSIGPGFKRKYEDSYEWLRPFRPIARAGQSIFIYQLP